MSESEDEGGLLPAALAGAGILLFAALLIFGTGDEAEPAAAKNAAGQAKAKSGPVGKAGVASRPVDSARRAPTETAAPPPPKHRINPAVQELLVTDEMRDPSAAPPSRPVFDTPEEERIFVQKQLDGAKRLLENRTRSLEKFTRLEEEAKNGPNPDEALDALTEKKTRLERAIEHSNAQVAKFEAKLAELG
jgi:hypothetical protein